MKKLLIILTIILMGFAFTNCEEKKCDTVAFDIYTAELVDASGILEPGISEQTARNLELSIYRKLSTYVRNECPECREYYEYKKDQCNF